MHVPESEFILLRRSCGFLPVPSTNLCTYDRMTIQNGIIFIIYLHGNKEIITSYNEMYQKKK